MTQSVANAQRGLHVMTKPIGPICNLDCAYCYYLDKEELYPRGEHWRMPEATLEAYVRQYIEAQPAGMRRDRIRLARRRADAVEAGLFRARGSVAAALAPANVSVNNSIQTNGVLLDDRWCEFFKENQFLIGLSIDGPRELHDKYRYDKQGQPTFDAVLRGLRCLQKHEVEYNVLTVVNSHNGSHGRKIYRFLKSLGVQFVQFIPIVERLGMAHNSRLPAPLNTPETPPEDLVTGRSVRPRQFGKFLIEVFDEWIRRDVGRVFVQTFDQVLAAWLDVEPGLCVFKRECGRALALEHNGDLYSCDHFVTPEHRLGNIHELPIVELANSPRQQQFGHDKLATLPQYCLDCDVRFVCNGECPKNRFIHTPDGEPGLNYLCAGYQMFFRHIDPHMKAMAAELRRGRPAANVMLRLNEEARRARAEAGQPDVRRNDPCPCGSGRRFKQCCLRRRSRS